MAMNRETVYKIDIEARSGALYEVLARTAEEDSNVVFLDTFTTGEGKGTLYIITDKAEVIEDLARARGSGVEEYVGFLFGGEDRVGLGADVIRPLAEAGVNIVLSAATVAGGIYSMLIMVEPNDAQAAEEAWGL
ncbi:MAG TPA: hypothetical protein VIK22_15030 [Candidatus Anoxymicrobiaceae bacterium]|jgi:hypothetical protein